MVIVKSTIFAGLFVLLCHFVCLSVTEGESHASAFAFNKIECQSDNWIKNCKEKCKGKSDETRVCSFNGTENSSKHTSGAGQLVEDLLETSELLLNSLQTLGGNRFIWGTAEIPKKKKKNGVFFVKNGKFLDNDKDKDKSEKGKSKAGICFCNKFKKA